MTKSVVFSFLGILLLAACDFGAPALSVSSPPPGQQITIVPGSRGIGNPPTAIEVKYNLGQAATVTAQLQGPVTSTLLQEAQRAGDHVLRFNGVVINPAPGSDGLVRRVVPDGDYRIALSASGTTQNVSFTVSNADTIPPAIENLILQLPAISPNSDAVEDVAEVTFRTNQTATLSVDLTASDGTITNMLAPIEKAGGEQNAVVSGQTPEGGILPDGTYTVTVRAQDRAGNRVEAGHPLTIEGGGEAQIEVVRVEISPDQIILGNSISVSVTVRNVGNVPLRTQGPDPGYTYTTNESYSSIEGGKLTDKAGLWRVGVDWDGNSGGGGPYRYPFRWGFGKTLMPGEQVTTGGTITILKQERKMWFYAGVLQEGVQIALDRLGRKGVDVDF